MKDLLLIETGGGGDLVLRGSDFVQVFGYETAVYLALFGGSEWWGNYLVPNSPFKCLTEQVLRTTPITSAGRIAIEQAVKADLNFLTGIAGTSLSTAVTIEGPNRIHIAVTINSQTYNYYWNPDTLFLTYEVG